jgi:putative hydrolase of the HAD superfamily
MIKTFIFDLGRVIVPYDHDRGLLILEKHCGIPIDDLRTRIYASEDLISYQTGKFTSEEFFSHLKTLFNLQIDFREFTRIWNHTFTLTPLIEESVIEDLAGRFRLLILSDTNELHFEYILEKFPILRHFDDFVLSYKVGFVKPAEEIFRIAVKQAQCAPEECIFTDDLLVNIEAARKIGINAIQFSSSEQFQKEIGNFILPVTFRS